MRRGRDQESWGKTKLKREEATKRKKSLKSIKLFKLIHFIFK
jgi:hypothetical protein